MKYFLTLGLALLFSTLLLAQDMTYGFRLLDVGEYGDATDYFQDVLTEYPDNKTAKICLGRALGLGGSTEQASSLLASLSTDYPGDLEVMLNFAESQLWKKDFPNALKLYKELQDQNPNNITVSLGLANTHAALHDYAAASRQILHTKSLDYSDQVQNSYKHINLALAHSIKDKEAERSYAILQGLNVEFPYDRSVLIALGYAAMQAENLSESLSCFTALVDRDIDVLQGYAGQAALHLHNTALAKAEDTALLTLPLLNANTDLGTQTQVYALLFDIYIARGKADDAKALLPNLKSGLSEDQYGEKSVYAALTSGEYNCIPSLIQDIKDKELANTLSLRYAMETKSFALADSLYRGIGSSTIQNSQLKQLMLNYELQNTFPLVAEYFYLKDNGDNTAHQVHVNLLGRPTRRVQPTLYFGSRTVSNILETTIGQNMVLLAGANLFLNQKHTTTLNAGMQSASFANGLSQNNLIFNIGHKIQFSARQHLSLAYGKSVMDYNKSLLSSSIATNTFSLEHHIYTGIKIGSFTQVYGRSISNGNQGIEAFNSLYYSILSVPTWQAGLNTNFLTFQETAIEYFSPDYLVALSLFSKLTNEYTPQKLKYLLGGSLGKQKINSVDKLQNIYSVSLGTGYRISKLLEVGAYFRYSNSSIVANNGYSAYQLGCTLKALLAYETLVK